MPAAPPTPPPSLSYELFPPRGPAAQDALLRTLDALAPTAPDWVSVTTGVQADRRAGCLDLLEHLVHHTLYRPLAHVIATGSTRGQLRELTARILDLGVRGILALRGDRPPGYVPGPEELPFARHLVELVREVEREHRAHLGAGRLAVGVAAYPVRHPESPSALHDIEVLLAKERAGADFAITQVCQDPQDHVRLRARAEQAGVGLPLVAGILPVTSLRRYERVCALAGLAVDERFAHRLETAESETQRRRVGVARAREQALAALDAGAPGLHLYTFNEHPAALELLEVLDLPRPSPTPRPPLGRRSPVETARGHLPSGSQPLDEEILPAPATEKQRHPGPPDRSRHPDHPHTRDTRSDAEETTVSTTDRTAEHTEERAALSTHGAAACPFPAATVLGYPRIGPRRELKRALERRWSGNADAADLASEVTALRVRTVARLRELGLTGCSAIPASFALYDQVLDAIVATGAVPARFHDLADEHGRLDREASFVLARGVAARGPLEMTKWFDTNYHYLVPEIGPETPFAANPEELKGQVYAGTYSPADAAALRPAVVGPVTFLLLAKPEDSAPAGYDPLDRLEDLLPVYSELIAALGCTGVRWVQLEEPALAADQDREDLPELVERAYRVLSEARAAEDPALLVTTAYGDARELLPVLARTGVEAVHADLASGRRGLRRLTAEQLEPFLAPQAPALVAGVVDGRNVWRTDLPGALDLLEELTEAGARVRVGTSTSLLHVPHDLEAETALPGHARNRLAFADQKVQEVLILARGLAEGREAIAEELAAAEASPTEPGRSTPDAGDPGLDAAVRSRAAAVGPQDRRREPGQVRRDIQRERGAAAGLGPVPTTTIGSFPQTPEIRRARAEHRAGRLSEEGYRDRLREEIARVIRLQEELGLDVLVHGEAERNDMVQYFAEHFEGFSATEHGWVQSYGSRCTRPSILWGDVSRKGEGVRGEAFTVPWITWAQSLTERPVKGMLTGPVTILAWSFVREDQPLAVTADQVALALRDEVRDLEDAGIGIVQVDEPALRELLPLRREDHAAYLEWAVQAFRLATSGVRAETQIHTHLCYSEFGEVLAAIDALDADVTSVEAARSRMELLAPLAESGFDRGIGPGVWDIHSPRVPAEEEIRDLLQAAARVVPADRLWANPDCGLKTRGYPETEAALRHLVAAAAAVRREAAARPEEAVPVA